MCRPPSAAENFFRLWVVDPYLNFFTHGTKTTQGCYPPLLIYPRYSTKKIFLPWVYTHPYPPPFAHVCLASCDLFFAKAKARVLTEDRTFQLSCNICGRFLTSHDIDVSLNISFASVTIKDSIEKNFRQMLENQPEFYKYKIPSYLVLGRSHSEFIPLQTK